MRLRLVLSVAGVAASLLAGACASERTIAGIARECGAAHAAFADELACTRTEIATYRWNDSPIADLIATYLAYADTVAARVRAGQESESQARQDLRTIYGRLKAEADERHRTWLNVALGRIRGS